MPFGIGQNYGWPIIQGEEKREGMVSPVVQSGPDVTWAPAGAAFLNGFLYITTSNRDGRGTPKEGDDKIIKIDPQKL